MTYSRREYSIRLSTSATPIISLNFRIAAGVTPRRLRPATVGMRGSSQPVT